MTTLATSMLQGLRQLAGALLPEGANTEGDASPTDKPFVFTAKDRRQCTASLQFNGADEHDPTLQAIAEGTCTWLLSHETYRAWATGGHGLLCINGESGSGKSTLLQFVLEHCGNGDVALSFFCHDGGDPLQTTPLGLLRSLALQMLNASGMPDTFPDLVRAYSKPHTPLSDDWAWEVADLQRYVAAALPNMLTVQPVWLVLDALDEYTDDDAASLLAWLRALLQSLPRKSFPCRICVSRSVVPVLAPTDYPLQLFMADEAKSDVCLYAREALTDCGLPVAFCERIAQRSAGNFLWARWMVDQVRNAKFQEQTLEQLVALVDETPSKLDDLFLELAMAMRQSPNREQALRLMQWICFAVRPLTDSEVDWALAGGGPYESLPQSIYGTPGVDETISLVKELGRGLIEYGSNRAGATVVRFLHPAVKLFFVRRGLALLAPDPGPGEPPANVAEAAHDHLAKVCLQYLALNESMPHPFAAYAAEAWKTHLAQSNSKGRLPLVWAADGGTPAMAVVELLLKNGAAVDEPGPDGRTALVAAAAGGHEAVARLLLANGADVNKADRQGGTPLHAAVSGGYQHMAEVLLESGAAANQADSQGRTALHCAALLGDAHMLRPLLRHHADPAIQDHSGRTALAWASERQHTAVVEKLERFRPGQ